MNQIDVNDYVVVVRTSNEHKEMLGKTGFVITTGGIGVDPDAVTVKLSDGRMGSFYKNQLRKYDLWWEPWESSMDAHFVLQRIVSQILLMRETSFKWNGIEQFPFIKTIDEGKMLYFLVNRYNVRDDRIRTNVDHFVDLIMREDRDRVNKASDWWSLCWTSMERLERWLEAKNDEK